MQRKASVGCSWVIVLGAIQSYLKGCPQPLILRLPTPGLGDPTAANLRTLEPSHAAQRQAAGSELSLLPHPHQADFSFALFTLHLLHQGFAFPSLAKHLVSETFPEVTLRGP